MFVVLLFQFVYVLSRGARQRDWRASETCLQSGYTKKRVQGWEQLGSCLLILEKKRACESPASPLP